MDRPLVGVVLVVRKEGKILLHKRLSKHAYGYYGAPGGHLEYGEEFADCALRELKEEAGDDLRVSPPKYATTINAIYPESHYVTVIMLSAWVSGEPIVTEPDKNEGWGWYAPSEIPGKLMIALDKYLNG